ncbi:hypothetical protein GCM10020221_18870 [Streptomyces thioluteus]|uniref:Uncharacterized protein n=1 Tax=Streptomyces thioluteus TaxID=66431 RepID=A0ABN3WQA8_STRTU
MPCTSATRCTRCPPTPLLERLRNGPRQPGNGLLDGITPDIGAGLLRYLVNRGILQIQGEEYFLTRLGEFLTTRHLAGPPRDLRRGLRRW